MSQPVEVNKNTIIQLEDLLKISNDKQIKTEIAEAIASSINKLWRKYKTNNVLIITSNTAIDVIPKKEYRQCVQELIGHNGPYKVKKIYKSWVGISDGVYILEEIDKCLPIAWFEPANKQTDYTSILVTILLILNILQTTIFSSIIF